jgi:hypothetical protein
VVVQDARRAERVDIAQDGSKNIAITADVAGIESVKSMAGAPPPEVAAVIDPATSG